MKTNSTTTQKGSVRTNDSTHQRGARPTSADDAQRGGQQRMMGAASKDSRHGVNTDRGTSRRTESRRDGSMGSESKAKSHRKNI